MLYEIELRSTAVPSDIVITDAAENYFVELVNRKDVADAFREVALQLSAQVLARAAD